MDCLENVITFDENGDDFTVGMYANATIVAENNPSYTVPITAVVVDGESQYIFVKTESSNEQATYHKLPVFTGLEP